jgi:hypothetical protein
MKHILTIFLTLGLLFVWSCDQPGKEDGTIEQQEEYRQDDLREERNFPIGTDPDTNIIPDFFNFND